MVESTGLENRRWLIPSVGSNPTSSAKGISMSTQITLEADECALVISNKRCEAYIPDPDNDEAKATTTEVLVAALALAIKRDDPHIKAIIGNFMKDYEEYISK